MATEHVPASQVEVVPPDDTPPIRAPRLLPMILRLSIVDKDARRIRLRDVIKPDQLDLIARAQHQLDTRGQIRLIILKARQIGMSTIIEAILFVLCMVYKDFMSLIMSHQNESSARILKMTRIYWNTYPFKRFYEERYNGRSHLAWDNDSDIHIATAKNPESGRSLTIQALHCSEVAFWPDPETLYNSLSHSVPAFGLNMIALESTANGVGNFFHQMCTNSMKELNDFEFIFYPWFNDKDYTLARLSPIIRDRYRVLDGELDEEEQLLRSQYHLTDEQLGWRRWCIANECQGDVEKFHQEYPSNPFEAFVSTGRNVFALKRLLAHSKIRRGLRGILKKDRSGKVVFVQDQAGAGHPGWLTIYAYPADKEWGHYVIGADPTHAPGGDFACAQVINRRTMEQVAVYRNREVDTVTFGKHLQLIGSYFNLAVIAAESTGPGYATTGCLVADHYPRVYQRQHVQKMSGFSTQGVAGWVTNMNTKEMAIQHLVKLFSEDLTDPGDGQEYGLLLHDRVTVMELRDYVTLDKGLGYGNSDGSEYDDGVMALAIACTVHWLLPPVPAYAAPDPLDARPTPRVPSLPSGVSGVITQSGTASLPRVGDTPSTDEHSEPPVWTQWGDMDIHDELA